MTANTNAVPVAALPANPDFYPRGHRVILRTNSGLQVVGFLARGFWAASAIVWVEGEFTMPGFFKWQGIDKSILVRGFRNRSGDGQLHPLDLIE